MIPEERRIEILEANLVRASEWLRASESRISLTLPLATVMLGVTATLLPNFSSLDGWNAILILISTALLTLSILFSGLVFFPRVKGPQKSLIFFANISELDLSVFKESMKQLSNVEYEEDLTEQVHTISRIATKKYGFAKISIQAIFLGVVPWILSIYHLYEEIYVQSQ